MSGPVAVPLYEVVRLDGPTPADAHFLVLDLAHDYHARVAARVYANGVSAQGQVTLAADVHRRLDESESAFRAWASRHNPPDSKRRRNKNKGH